LASNHAFSALPAALERGGRRYGRGGGSSSTPMRRHCGKRAPRVRACSLHRLSTSGLREELPASVSLRRSRGGSPPSPTRPPRQPPAVDISGNFRWVTAPQIEAGFLAGGEETWGRWMGGKPDANPKSTRSRHIYRNRGRFTGLPRMFYGQGWFYHICSGYLFWLYHKPPKNAPLGGYTGYDRDALTVKLNDTLMCCCGN
jgi:hypothetical protein